MYTGILIILFFPIHTNGMKTQTQVVKHVPKQQVAT